MIQMLLKWWDNLGARAKQAAEFDEYLAANANVIGA